MPDFVPESIVFSEELSPMHFLVESYLVEAEESVSDARTALTNTLLNDPALIDALLRYLNSSEKTLASAKIMFDQNYLYSAGNFAFLSKVDSGFVKDVAENPEIVSPTSTLLNSKLQALSLKIDSLALDLNQGIPVDKFEWHIAAKQRLSWARMKVDAIAGNGDIVITIGGPDIDEQRVSDLLDYEFAVAWHAIAEDFFVLSKGSKKRFAVDNYFANAVDSYIANTEKSLELLDEVSAEDVVRRLDSARLENSFGWHYAAMFDASSALALANSEIFVKNKDFNVLSVDLSERIDRLELKMTESGYDFVWARLYLDHAKQFLKSGEFYLGQGQTAKALDSVKSGISLVFLAASAAESGVNAYQYFDSLPDSRFTTFEQPFAPAISELFAFAVLVAFLVALLVTVFLVFSLKHRVPRLRKVSLDSELKKVLKAQKKLGKDFEAKKISHSDFNKINSVYLEQLHELTDERSQMSKSYVELDLSKTKAFAFERALRRLKKEFRAGRITERDFEGAMRFCSRKIDVLNKEIAEDLVNLKEEKSDVVEAVERSKESRERVSKKRKLKILKKRKSLKKTKNKPKKMMAA